MKPTTLAINALVALALLLAGCLAEPSDAPADVFEAVWSDFDRLYGPFEQRGVDWDAVYERHRPAVSDDMTEDELWDALGAMLAELDDGHVMMAAPGRPRFHSNRVRRENLQDDAFDLDVVRDRYLSDVHEDPHYLYGTLDDDLAYVWFPYIADNMATIDTVIDEFPDAKGLVIDLRHNSGGDFTWAFEYLGRLTTKDRFVFRSRTRNGPDRVDFDDWTEWTLNARPDPFTRPIVLLTDGHTISAGERTVMALQVLPTVTTVGMPTNGSQSTMIGREAPNRWTFTLPVQEVEFADGNVYEGRGMPVDVEVRNSPDDLEEGVDTMLEQAIQQLTGR